MRVCTCLCFCCSDWLYFELKIKTFYLQVKDYILHSKEKRKLFTGIVTYFVERDYKK